MAGLFEVGAFEREAQYRKAQAEREQLMIDLLVEQSRLLRYLADAAHRAELRAEAAAGQ